MQSCHSINIDAWYKRTLKAQSQSNTTDIITVAVVQSRN